MNNRVLYLCYKCAQDYAAALKLTGLKPKTDTSPIAKPCEACKKKRYGSLYYVREDR